MGRVCRRKTKVVNLGYICQLAGKKEAKISESKQRRMLFVGATGESLRTSYGTKRCPIHQSTNHILQQCKSFEGMLTNEKVKVIEEHKLCLCCLLPGQRLSKCRRRNRCKVENCDKRHHTLYTKST